MGLSVIGKERRIYSCDVCSKELSLTALDELEVSVHGFWAQKKFMLCGGCGGPVIALIKKMQLSRKEGV